LLIVANSDQTCPKKASPKGAIPFFGKKSHHPNTTIQMVLKAIIHGYTMEPTFPKRKFDPEKKNHLFLNEKAAKHNHTSRFG
jgi:hypothetical protein